MSCTAFPGALRLHMEKEIFMNLPNDPVILLSYINTLLRDEYPSFTELCKSLCIPEEEISSKLSGIGYVYDPNTNSFR
jgi:hypothetical protein